MNLADLIVPMLVVASAIAYALFTGRAQASRLRSLHAEVSNGTLRGHLVIVAVIFMILVTLVL